MKFSVLLHSHVTGRFLTTNIIFSLFSSDDSLTVLILAASWLEAGRGRSTGRGRSSARGRSLARETPRLGRASPPRQPRPRRRRCCRVSPARARRSPAACRATTSSQLQRTQHRTHTHTSLVIILTFVIILPSFSSYLLLYIYRQFPVGAICPAYIYIYIPTNYLTLTFMLLHQSIDTKLALV